MKKTAQFSIAVLAILFCSAITLQAQDFATAVTLKKTTLPVETNTSGFVAPLMTLAAFPGGAAAWEQYLKENLVYPMKAREHAIEGTVLASFEVSAKGEVKNIQIEQSPGYGCEEEVKRLLANAPRWQPAMQGNYAVKSNMKATINFRLQK